jgi:hypothetical protein
VRPERFELPAYCSGGNRSIQLSYGRARKIIHAEDDLPGDGRRFDGGSRRVAKELSYFVPAASRLKIPFPLHRLSTSREPLGANQSPRDAVTGCFTHSPIVLTDTLAQV